jgi:hypothetical protein
LIRKAFLVGVLSAVVVGSLALVSSAYAASGGGCHLQGTASFSPGLTNNDQNFTYSFSGNLVDCHSSVAGAPATGTVSAGRVETDPATGEQFQEPVPSGRGSCVSGTTSGTAIATWVDGSTTVVSYSTDAVTGAVKLSGTVIASVTLQAINPAPGQPTSKTITTTRYAGSDASGALTFQPPDPTQCNTSTGVGSAAIDGVATFSNSA